jgi:lincosamide nucleotidyltransferase A/C/D/E
MTQLCSWNPGGVSGYAMPAHTAVTLVAALQSYDVDVCVAGGWAVDALVRGQTRRHADLDLWVNALDTEGLLAALTAQGVDRIHPWPGDRPWNFVLHDGNTRRVDLHFYEKLRDGQLHYGSVTGPFRFTEHDLSGEGEIAGTTVRCERPEFAFRNHTGYPLRDIDEHDIALLKSHFGL